MRMSYVLLAVMALGCGGSGGDGGYSTGPTTGGNNNPPSGGGTGNATGSASVTVQSSDDGYGYQTFAFSPSSVTITKGGTVTWNNTGSTAHNVTFTSQGAPTGVGNFTSSSKSVTFPNSGTFQYQCTNHPGMTGAVTVQ
jgi:plastocyanin